MPQIGRVYAVLLEEDEEFNGWSLGQGYAPSLLYPIMSHLNRPYLGRDEIKANLVV